MEILNEMPVILTKDTAFIEAYANEKRRFGNIRPGMAIQLPEDAVLVMLPQITHEEVEVRVDPEMFAPGKATVVPNKKKTAKKVETKPAATRSYACRECKKAGRHEETCSKYPGMKKSAEIAESINEHYKKGNGIGEEKTRIVEAALEAGIGVVMISQDTGVSKATIYVIRKRLEKEGRLTVADRHADEERVDVEKDGKPEYMGDGDF